MVPWTEDFLPSTLGVGRSRSEGGSFLGYVTCAAPSRVRLFVCGSLGYPGTTLSARHVPVVSGAKADLQSMCVHLEKGDPLRQILRDPLGERSYCVCVCMYVCMYVEGPTGSVDIAAPISSWQVYQRSHLVAFGNP